MAIFIICLARNNTNETLFMAYIYFIYENIRLFVAGKNSLSLLLLFLSHCLSFNSKNFSRSNHTINHYRTLFFLLFILVCCNLNFITFIMHICVYLFLLIIRFFVKEIIFVIVASNLASFSRLSGIFH